MNRGRPSKYSPTAIEAVYDYLDECSSDNLIPFVEELAYRLRVDDSTLRHWTKKDKDFEEAYDMLLTVQKFDLKRKMLVGVYPCRAACLLLSSDHHVSTRKRIEIKNDKETTSPAPNLSLGQQKQLSEEITKLFEKIYSKPRTL